MSEQTRRGWDSIGELVGALVQDRGDIQVGHLAIFESWEAKQPGDAVLVVSSSIAVYIAPLVGASFRQAGETPMDVGCDFAARPSRCMC